MIIFVVFAPFPPLIDRYNPLTLHDNRPRCEAKIWIDRERAMMNFAAHHQDELIAFKGYPQIV